MEQNNIHKELIEVWNVQDGVPAFYGAQHRLNILGRIDNADIVEALVYRLNGGPEIQVFFKNGNSTSTRLARQGDFNIDTITQDQLMAENQLQVIASLKNGTRVSRSFVLTIKRINSDRRNFRMDLTGIDYAHEVGQLIDGKWAINRDEIGKACLEIRPEDAGLDRIILFGTEELRSDYTIRARMQVNRWLAPLHNLGLLFKWNPHLQGDGTCLPSQWTTGLGYYYSHCLGLRIRIGIDVHLNEYGEKVGDNILGESALRPSRYWANRIVRKITQGRYMVPQIIPGVPYWFELRVDSDAYALTVWPVRETRPSPQVVVNNPPELLAKGAVGIIAHYCAVRVFEFHIESHGDSKDS